MPDPSIPRNPLDRSNRISNQPTDWIDGNDRDDFPNYTIVSALEIGFVSQEQSWPETDLGSFRRFGREKFGFVRANRALTRGASVRFAHIVRNWLRSHQTARGESPRSGIIFTVFLKTRAVEANWVRSSQKPTRQMGSLGAGVDSLRGTSTSSRLSQSLKPFYCASWDSRFGFVRRGELQLALFGGNEWEQMASFGAMGKLPTFGSESALSAHRTTSARTANAKKC